MTVSVHFSPPKSQLVAKILEISKNPLVCDATVTISVLAASYEWLKLWSILKKKNVVSANLSRKIIHCASVPFFVLFWPFFSKFRAAKYFAALIPLLQASNLFFQSGHRHRDNLRNDTLIFDISEAISRTGDKKELLVGPMIYTIALLAVILIWFRDSPTGVVALSQLAMGDGLADIFGRRFGKSHWRLSPSKTHVGSLAFFLGGMISSYLSLWWLNKYGFISMDLLSMSVVSRLAFISIVCALVELVPAGIDDNIVVPVVGAALSMWLLEPLNTV